jgi:hypothetical protein
MPDTGYQTLRPKPLERPDPIHTREDILEPRCDDEPAEETSSKWPLIWTVTIACTLGVAVWSALMYNIWGGLL